MDQICGDCGDEADEFMECCHIYLCERCADIHRAKYEYVEDQQPNAQANLRGKIY